METIFKGRIAEAKVVAELVSDHYEVFVPAFGNAKCDLIVLDAEQKTARIEVKYSSRKRASGAYEVGLRQVRANKANLTTKKFNKANSDFLAVYNPELDSVAFVSSSFVDGKSTIHLHPEQFGKGMGNPIGDGIPLEPERA